MTISIFVVQLLTDLPTEVPQSNQLITHPSVGVILTESKPLLTEPFVHHFNEQLRQLEEISDPSELFPPQIELQLLQNTVRPINDLRIVETPDEFQSKTTD